MSLSFAEELPVIGSRVGPYRILRKLGAGGMGAVYLAKREDDVLHMNVCIKFLHEHMNTPEVLARFRRERQLMADLNHPHIATLLDAGLTEKGRPYIIMEHIRGRHIDAWFRDTHPDLALLLETFLKVVEAVGSAHEQGIIHRDIKPQNILVTDQNIPKLLDFGIAHFAETGDGRSEQGPMTPAYAAPEQRFARGVSPATDVYALGLVLFQLLSGAAPYRLGCSPREAVDHLLQGRLLAEDPAFAEGAPTLCHHAAEKTIDTPEALTPNRDSQGSPPPPRPGGARQPFPEALGYVLRRCLADWGHERFANGNTLATALKRLKKNVFHLQSAPTDPAKSLDAVFWCHPHDRDQVTELTAVLAERYKLRVQPKSREGAAELDDERFETTVANAHACVICLGRDDHIPWWVGSAQRDALAFYAGDLNLVPLLLPGAAFPEKQSALPGFLRGRTWRRVNPGNEHEMAALVAAIHGKTRDEKVALQPNGLCPFRGLEVFREEDQHLFFGREALSQAVLEHVRVHRFSAVCGPSGSGKSSLVQAGVLPALRKKDTAVLLMAPTQNPFAELAFGLSGLFATREAFRPAEHLLRRLQASSEALTTILRDWQVIAEQTNLCLVIDQFEELFTLADEAETTAFADSLCRLLDQADPGIQVLLTMRADFLGKCAVHFGLNNYIVDHLFQVMPMDRVDLARAITAPALLAGLRLEAGLLDRLLDDVAGAAGKLPLLEHALLELYERREEGLLTRAAYDAVGGIAGALAGRAEQEYAALTPEAQKALRSMFTLCLVHPGEGTQDTRRRATQKELAAVGGEHAQALLDDWTAARLLSSSHDSVRNVILVDVAHEALIRNWHRIREWMDEDRDTARRINRLRRRAAEWDDAGRDRDHLLRGGPLLQMAELQENHGGVVGALETEFVTRSLEGRAREQQRQRLMLVVVSALGLVSAALAVFAFTLFFQSKAANAAVSAARERAETARNQAEQQTLASNYNLALALNEKAGIALDNGKAQEAWLLSLAALSQEIPADKALPEPVGRFADPRLQAKNRLLWTSPVVTSAVQLAVSDDGRWIALADRQGLVRLLNGATGIEEAVLGQVNQGVSHLAFRPDGGAVAAGSRQGGVIVWDLARRHGLKVGENTGDGVAAQALSADGRWIAVAHDSGTLVLADPQNNRTLHHFADLGWPSHLVFLDDVLFAANQAGALWHLPVRPGQTPVPRSLSPAREHPVRALGLIGDDRVGLVDGAGRFELYRHDGTRVQSRELNHTVTAAGIARTDGRIVLADGKAPLRVWDPDAKQEYQLETGTELQQLFLHGETLSGLDPTGRLLRLDIHTGKPRQALLGAAAGLWRVAYSPDGTKLAAACLDGSVLLYRPREGVRQTKVLRGHQGVVFDVAFSPDGKRLASCGEDQTIRLWNLADGRETAVLRGHENTVFSVAFSPDGRRLVSGSGDRTLRLWDPDAPADQGPLAVFTGHAHSIYSVVYSPDGTRVASAAGDTTVRLWDPEAAPDIAQKRMYLGHRGRVWEVVFSPDGNRLATAGEDKTVRLWDNRVPEAEAARQVFHGHRASVSGVAFSPDGTRIASSSGDSTVRLWDAAAPAETALRGVLRGHHDAVWDVAYAPEGTRLAGVSVDQTLRIWDPREDAVTPLLTGHTENILGMAFAPNGQLLASASQDGTVRVWDPRTGEARAVLRGHTGAVNDVVFSPDGKRLATIGLDHSLRMWDPHAPPGKAARGVIGTHQSSIRCVAFSPDGRRIATGGRDQSVRLWDPSAPPGRAAVAVFEGHGASVIGLAFSPDSRLLASGSRDQTARLWRYQTADGEKEPVILRGHAGSVIGVAFSPDGALLATASHDQSVRLWDPNAPAAEAERAVLHGHQGAVYGVGFSPDGALLATASSDLTVRLWDVRSRRPLAVLEGHSSGLNFCAAFQPGGSQLATVTNDNRIRFWHLARLIRAPADVPAFQYYRELRDRALYQMGYRLDGFLLIPQPHLRLEGVGKPVQPSNWDHLDQPYQPGTDYARWLLGEDTSKGTGL
ncbi:WD40 repeat domain-containing serine/threonine-protein kinase [Acanthopleuribacter pedis]|uniref:Protein kinase n=1 Tax=Acanthopleuribacter pedis TaxID=442870 RepID=A0A8J7U8F0_9BACT|nr:protein kinase [Acanthopleuribacter pedis]MBO1322476.1 protein kinase [Acanthopleuribacter pedis]